MKKIYTRRQDDRFVNFSSGENDFTFKFWSIDNKLLDQTVVQTKNRVLSSKTIAEIQVTRTPEDCNYVTIIHRVNALRLLRTGCTRYAEFRTTSPELIQKWIDSWCHTNRDEICNDDDQTLSEFTTSWLKHARLERQINDLVYHTGHAPSSSERAIIEAYNEFISSLEWN